MPDPNPAAPGAPQLTLDTASQAETLDQVGGIAKGLQGGNAPDAPGAPTGTAVALSASPLALANAALIGNMLKTMRDGFCQFTTLHAPRAIATDRAIDDLARGWGEWCAAPARSIDLKAYMGKHGDTIPLALSTAMLAIAVVQATRSEIATRRPIEARPIEARPAAAPAAQAAPGAPGAPAGDAGSSSSNVHVFPGTGGLPE